MNLIEQKNLSKVKGEDVIKALKKGEIITWNNPTSLVEPRFYRYKNEIIEYTDNLIEWKNSSKTLVDFEDEWLVVSK